MEKYRTSNSRIDEKVMIGLSGGSSSRAMLHLLCEIFSHELSKKQSFTEVLVCHIDENSIFNLKDSTINQVEQIIQKYNSSFIGLRIEDIYSDEFTSNMEFGQVLKISLDKSKQQEFNEFNAIIRQNKELSNKEKLQSLLECISNLTSKEDFVWYLKLSLLIQIARDCSTRLATKIISLTSKGRGFSFETVFIPSLTSLRPSKSSIERLTEDFIVGLERDYPSTVSTIARTGSKLTTSNSIDDENRCALCLIITVTKIPSSFTSSISTTNDCNTTTNNYNDHCNLFTKSCSQSCCSNCINLDHQNIEINNTLCHACRVNMHDINEIFLPPYVAEEAKKQNRRLDLRKNIEEFLIDDIDNDQ
ncbi:9994_t:CDS:2 [Diversispora eburnea]|uniref:9994_t:CDS:1 n=1 Tax=Diversispora eburnea TaxID=1213867 RepID=A0A9N8VXD9_9GLOM|nr:9994_t:CDS:2 [Diversispora eburnea]